MTTVDKEIGDADMKFNDVFKSLDAVKKCLNSEKYFHLPEVQQLLDIYSKNTSVIHDEVVDRSQRKVFIVLEGIDASGKTTIGKRLSKLIGGKMLSTPPPMIAGLREQFDKQGRELRRAYYALGNYLAAQQVKEIYKTQPVIMDRFWHSTAAYAIAEHALAGSGKVPEVGHEVYKWPEDLVKPDIVFFLSVSESKRLDRLLRRTNKEVTREELKMKDNKVLRDALARACLNMRNPSQVTLDSDVMIEDVLAQIEEVLLEKFQIQLPDIEPFIPKDERPLCNKLPE